MADEAMKIKEKIIPMGVWKSEIVFQGFKQVDFSTDGDKVINRKMWKKADRE